MNSRKFVFHKIGFHGDKYLIDVIDELAPSCKVFIETGSNVGSSLSYFAKKYPNTNCLSCEPDLKAFKHAQTNTSSLQNVQIFNLTSQDFFAEIEKNFSNIFDEPCLFWLDAHGWGFEWPLKFEVNFITRNFSNAHILIDDFKVPGLEDYFGYDVYNNQECSFDFISDDVSNVEKYELYYPDYTEKTSQHHPLRGWGLLKAKNSNFDCVNLSEKNSVKKSEI